MAFRTVECHSEYTYAERPVAVYWEGERLTIIAIEAHWHTPEARNFKVRVEDGRIFKLSYRESLDEWQIHES
jgi:hypothetical protein